MFKQRTRRQVCSLLGIAGLSGCLSFTAADEQPAATPETSSPQSTPAVDTTSASRSEPTDKADPEGWPYSLPAPVTTTPLIHGSTVFFGCMDHKLYAVDIESGAQEFATDVGDEVGPGLTIAEGVVYGSSPAGIFGVDARTGELSLSMTNRAVGFGIREPLVADGVLYYPAGSTLLAIDISSGEVLWNRDAPAVWGGKPALANGTLIASDAGDVDTTPSDRSRVFGLDPTDGSLQWEVTITADSLVSAVAGNDDDTVVLSGRYGITAAFDTTTGEERWRVSIERGGNVPANPLVAQQTAVVPLGPSGVFAYDLQSGDEQWAKTDDSVSARYDASAVDSQVLLGADVATLLDLTTGEVGRQFELTPQLGRSVQPTLTDNALIYPAVDSTLQRVSR